MATPNSAPSSSSTNGYRKTPRSASMPNPTLVGKRTTINPITPTRTAMKPESGSSTYSIPSGAAHPPTGCVSAPTSRLRLRPQNASAVAMPIVSAATHWANRGQMSATAVATTAPVYGTTGSRTGMIDLMRRHLRPSRLRPSRAAAGAVQVDNSTSSRVP
jgi:hypothetical protein